MQPKIWLSELLAQRHLPQPDGRMLYRYRLTAEEYRSLRETLSFATAFGSLGRMPLAKYMQRCALVSESAVLVR